MKQTLLGIFEYVEEDDWYVSKPVIIPGIDDTERKFILEWEPCPEDLARINEAVQNIMHISRDAIEAMQPKLRKCYDLMVSARPRDSYTPIPQDANILDHIKIGDEIWISMNVPDSPTVEFSLEAHCSWDLEHGLNIVIREGIEIRSVEPH